MQAQQVAQPNQEAQMPENQKAFADLLFTMMDVIEKYQEGENGEGNYLTAMNSLRDLHKFKEQLKSGSGRVVFLHYEAVHRAPAPSPVRQQAARKKYTDEQKREHGYVCCVKCGRLFSDNSKLKRHQETTEICRHIIHEKEVAVQTKQVERTKGPGIGSGRAARGQARKAFVLPPDDHCLTKKHPFYGSFVHSFMLFVEGRKAELKQIWLRNDDIWNQECSRTLHQEREAMRALPPLFCGERVLNKDKIIRETKRMNFYDAYSHTITIDGSVKIFTTAAVAPTSPNWEPEDDTEEMALLMKYAGAVESEGSEC